MKTRVPADTVQIAIGQQKRKGNGLKQADVKSFAIGLPCAGRKTTAEHSPANHRRRATTMATSRIYDVPNGRGFAREESRRVPAVLGPAADPLRQLHAPETDQRLAVIVGAHVAPAPSNDIDVDAICAGRFNADTDKVFGLNRPGYITVHGFAVLL